MKTNLLKAKMVEVNVTREDLAKALNIDPSTFTRKMASKKGFYAAEIAVISKKLHLTSTEEHNIFLG